MKFSPRKSLIKARDVLRFVPANLAFAAVLSTAAKLQLPSHVACEQIAFYVYAASRLKLAEQALSKRDRDDGEANACGQNFVDREAHALD